MRRAVQAMVENQLSECLLSGFASDGDFIQLDFDDTRDEIIAANKTEKKTFPLEQFGGIEDGFDDDDDSDDDAYEEEVKEEEAARANGNGNRNKEFSEEFPTPAFP